MRDSQWGKLGDRPRKWQFPRARVWPTRCGRVVTPRLTTGQVLDRTSAEAGTSTVTAATHENVKHKGGKKRGAN